MAFGVDAFLSSISKTGVAKAHSFEVIINPPTIPNVAGQTQPDARHLAMRIETVDFPGRTAMTSDYTTDFGPIRKIPYSAMFGDITTQIVLSDDMREKTFIEAWQDLMVGNHRLKGPNEKDAWTTGYYDSYVGNMIIKQYDDKGDESYMCSLEECYPAIMAPINGNWGSSDIHKLPVSWYYRYFRDQRQTLTYAAEVKKGGFLATSGLGGLLGVGVGALAGKLGPAVGSVATTGLGILQGSARLAAVTKGR
jgi:hypothetical protein